MKTVTLERQMPYFLEMLLKSGPEESEYQIINDMVNNIKDEKEAQLFRKLIEPVLNENTLYGYTYLKPLGYAGDFMLIERMYQEYVSKDPKWEKWDIYYHSHEATKAVRNRKKYFVKIMEQLISKSSGPVNVLILGSGPATDVHDFFLRNPKADVAFDLLDIDQRAIDYAIEKNNMFLHKINFTRMNVLRFQPYKKYDLIWSAGLFDYLNDRLFTGLINRFKNNLKHDGEMIIGNFSQNNPTQRVMEVIGEWFLNHRSSKHLTQLAMNGGISYDQIYVDKEPLGINLFLRIEANTEQEEMKANLEEVKDVSKF
jgi:extracellular factor (EF) 3-hydroxypalmitic acid methyl ester biosynthesis protein